MIYKPLTERQVQVAKLCAMGNSAKEIGKILKLGPETIKSHIREIRQKTNLRSQNQFWMIFRLSELEQMKTEGKNKSFQSLDYFMVCDWE